MKNFTCQHGPTECYGNKVHACVIDLASEEVSTEFVFCSERSDAPADDTNLQEVGIFGTRATRAKPTDSDACFSALKKWTCPGTKSRNA